MSPARKIHYTIVMLSTDTLATVESHIIVAVVCVHPLYFIRTKTTHLIWLSYVIMYVCVVCLCVLASETT